MNTIEKEQFIIQQAKKFYDEQHIKLGASPVIVTLKQRKNKHSVLVDGYKEDPSFTLDELVFLFSHYQKDDKNKHPVWTLRFSTMTYIKSVAIPLT